MRFVILRVLTHSELGMFHEYRRQGREGSKQRAVNFDWDVVDRVFPAARDSDVIEMDLLYDTDSGARKCRQWLKRQDKNWRLEGNCPTDKCYRFVGPGCLFAMEIEAGTTPATGAWAVFPPNHAVTKAIMSDAESSGLAKSAMIALHDDEGRQTRQLLSDARPDLFARAGRGTEPPAARSSGVELAPNPGRLVQILAAVGHSMPSAVADLVDNAISAGATDIAITFGRPDSGHGRWMTIADNGRGMSSSKLAEAMRIGSDADYEANSLGKYGYGLKGASWSQAKVFTVVTKCEGADAHHLTWDVNDMEGWMAKNGPLEPWEEDATTLSRHGTVVLWKEMRPPQSTQTARGLDPYSSEIMQLERHLALVFHRFLEGKAVGRSAVSITINGVPVKPNDPFGHPLSMAYDSKRIRIPTATDDGFVTVRPYLLPSEDEIAAYHSSDGADVVRRALDLIGLHGKRNETQGLFIYRHDRLIKWGGWHQMWETSDEKTKLARVQVDFDSVLDDAFRINISKQSVQLPQQLQTEIKKLAEVARKASQAKYRKSAAKATAATASPPSRSDGQIGSTSLTRAAAASVDDPSRFSGPAGANDPKGVQPTTASTIAVKEVKTDRFLWKLTRGINGTLDVVQISELSPSLSALAKQIRADHEAIAHLSEFLGILDEVDAQKSLMTKRTK